MAGFEDERIIILLSVVYPRLGQAASTFFDSHR